MTGRGCAGDHDRLRDLLQRQQRLVSGAWLALGLAVAILIPTAVTVWFLHMLYGHGAYAGLLVEAAQEARLGWFLAAAAASGVAAAILAGRSVALTRRLVGDLQATSSDSDGEGLAALIGLWSASRGGVRRALRAALLTRLHNLGSEGAEALTEWHRAALHHTFRGTDEDLVVAACNALALAGRRDALVPLERLSAGQTYALARRESVRRAASEALSVLRERLAREQAHAHLLRPASGGAEGTLLRAAGAAQRDETSLLRPLEPGSEWVEAPAVAPCQQTLALGTDTPEDRA
ncbi:MAG TPA: hypothetical protein VLH79_12440 [Chthonomonadales bacterium]|nr:hypothetical protein [Chthonomonadales bacterium]